MNLRSNPVRILVADRQPVFRSSLRRLFTSTTDLCVVGEASNAGAVITAVHQIKPHVIILDVGLSERSELTRLKSVIDLNPPVHIVSMLPSLERPHVIDALRIGSRGIVLKTSAAPSLFESVRCVADGGYSLGTEVLTILIPLLQDVFARDEKAAPVESYALTHRELEIIAKIATGRSNREVAQVFSISERTVKHHLTNIFNKIGVSNRLGLALFAVNHRLMSQTEPYLTSAVHSDWTTEAASISS